MSKLVYAVLIAAALIAAPLNVQAEQKSDPATETTTKDKPKVKRSLTPGQKAARERQRQCGKEWRAAKKAGTIEKGMTWPKFWSACNKRLKAKSG
jgi:hypothetical protein